MTYTILPPPAPPPAAGDNYSIEHGCFEGPEKLLEVWFSPSAFNYSSGDNSDSDGSAPVTPNDSVTNLSLGFTNDLRTVDRTLWDSILSTVNCTVLSIVKNAHVDAYLLSESSMFVFPHKIVLKTCGTTTLLKALPYILETAKSHCGFNNVYRLFYSRKSFMFPERQPGPHRSWDEEVEYLDNHFENGASYVIGDTKEDEWYLYMTSPETSHHYYLENRTNMQQLMKETNGLGWMQKWNQKITSLYSSVPAVFSVPAVLGYRAQDETIEILMTGLNAQAMEPFYHKKGEMSGLVGGKRVDVDTGLDKLYPQAQVDSFLFEPCGYSCNGLYEDGYYTIHVTPEPQCSFASFETTIPHFTANKEAAIQRLISQVTNIFRPTSFTVTYFASHKNQEEQVSNIGTLVRSVNQFKGYRRKDKIIHELEGYDLIYGHYKLVQ